MMIPAVRQNANINLWRMRQRIAKLDLLVEQGTPSSFVIVCIFYQKNSPHEKASYPSLGFLHDLQD
jgi:hypothetical protein